MIRSLPILVFAVAIAGCEELGIPDPQKVAAAAEAEGRAIGSACRHAGRALEDCYALNPSASKASVFDGWRTMNDYMTENKIEVVPPKMADAMPMSRSRDESAAPSEEADNADESDESADAPTAEEKPDRPRRSRTLRSLQDR